VRRADLAVVAEQLAPPVGRFVRDARARLELLMNASGQVLAQHGFTRSLDVIQMASLGAAIHASSRELARMLGEPAFRHLHQGSGQGQIFIASFATPAEELILIAIFDEDSSVGLVRVLFLTFARETAALPGWITARPTPDAESFERDLEAGLGRLFG
jgi:hypothetical protein